MSGQRDCVRGHARDHGHDRNLVREHVQLRQLVLAPMFWLQLG